ncbi:MAG: hypothetical protein P8X63_04435 [Desulfuromonadaceae bacterium]
MADLVTLLSQARVLPHLPACLDATERCYLVGGALRDFLLERPCLDFDFATPGDPSPLAKRFAAAIGGSWFLLDRERKQSRVVLKRQEQLFTYDFTPFRADSLTGDLRLRDFTINALALDLSDPGGAMIDPLAGRRDLSDRVLRICSPEVLRDDPLRILRGIRLAATLDLRMEAETWQGMLHGIDDLSVVALERITHEVTLILSDDSAVCGLGHMAELGLLPLLFGPCAGQGSYARGIEYVRQLSARLTIDREITANQSREGLMLLRLAAFFAGSCLDPERILRDRLCFSRRNITLIHCLLRLDCSSAAQLCNATPPGRGRALLLESLGPNPQLCLRYLQCFCEVPDDFHTWAQEAWTDYQTHVRHGRIPDLVSGTWLRQELKLSDGEQIGRYLQRLRQEERAGRVRDLESAHKFLKSLATKNIDKRGDPT